MAYHFGNERRRGSDRRAARNPAFAGVERRLAQRRVAPARERTGPFAGILLLLIAFVLTDTLFWDGYYRHAIYRGVNAEADSVRSRVDNIWDWQSQR